MFVLFTLGKMLVVCRQLATPVVYMAILCICTHGRKSLNCGLFWAIPNLGNSDTLPNALNYLLIFQRYVVVNHKTVPKLGRFSLNHLSFSMGPCGFNYTRVVTNKPYMSEVGKLYEIEVCTFAVLSDSISKRFELRLRMIFCSRDIS